MDKYALIASPIMRIKKTEDKQMAVIIKDVKRLEMFRETYKLQNGYYPRVTAKLTNHGTEFKVTLY